MADTQVVYTVKSARGYATGARFWTPNLAQAFRFDRPIPGLYHSARAHARAHARSFRTKARKRRQDAEQRSDLAGYWYEPSARAVRLVKRPASAVVNLLVKAHNLYLANGQMCVPSSALAHYSNSIHDALVAFRRSGGSDMGSGNRMVDLVAFRSAIELARLEADAAHAKTRAA